MQVEHGRHEADMRNRAATRTGAMGPLGRQSRFFRRNSHGRASSVLGYKCTRESTQPCKEELGHNTVISRPHLVGSRWSWALCDDNLTEHVDYETSLSSGRVTRVM